jgi:hypothetical protein
LVLVVEEPSSNFPLLERVGGIRSKKMLGGGVQHKYARSAYPKIERIIPLIGFG